MKLLDKFKEFLADNIFKREIRKTVEFHLFPNRINEIDGSAFFRSTIKTHISFIALYIVVNLILSMFNLSYLVEYSQIMRGYLVEGKISVFLYLLNAFPYNIFFFAFFLIVFELYFSIGTFLTVRVFGEKNVNFRKCVSLVVSSNVYILLSLFPILFFFTIMPSSAKRDIYYMILFLGFVSLFLIAGIFLQTISFIRMSKTVFEQNIGRSFLTWFLPLFAIFLFFFWSYRPL
ncbi:hypothetical protein LFX25_05185 [Leptospira sp. FAT2]|uniref:hypothetical protein n=1 Tax=Leptospira sanjuanensis TaxID=2879643 RepID=UPI001EE7A87F|nr:hypothetical protein [Leptospira sanjuanensis]MCG6167171.1 hypothetical protein [Leptospira sanjuanensis]MCG6192630.1 hypothetical protein [Leptospira sanjuanensis]